MRIVSVKRGLSTLPLIGMLACVLIADSNRTVLAHPPNCISIKTTDPRSASCNCTGGVSDGSCGGAQYTIGAEYTCIGANAGGSSCLHNTTHLGDVFPCTSDFNLTKAIACAAAIGIACAIPCATVSPLCLACLAAGGATILAGCGACDLWICAVGEPGTQFFGNADGTSGSCP